MAVFDAVPLQVLLSFYSRLAESAITRLQEISEEIDRNEYTPAKFFSDTVKAWMQGTTSLWAAWQQAASGGVPVMFFKLKPDDEADRQSIAVQVPQGAQPEITELVSLGAAAAGEKLGRARRLSPGDVELSLEKNRLSVVVRGQQALGKTAPRAAAGTYQALVHVNKKPLAIIYVEVAD